MKSNLPKLPLVFSILFFIASALLLGFLYIEIGHNQTSSQQMQVEWQTEQTRQEDLKSLESSLKSVAPERAELETHFAKSSDVVPFLDMIEKLAVATGAEAEVEQVSVSDDKTSLIVNMKAKGSFDATYKFIRLLENSPYELEINSLNMQKQGVGDPTVVTQEWITSIAIKLISFAS